MKTTWKYGVTTSDKLNIRKSPSLTAQRWNNIWPINRIALIKVKDEDWYETLYRGEPAFVSSKFITLLSEQVPTEIVQRMNRIGMAELGRNQSIFFNGYTGKWCHRFADWLAMHAGQPKTMIPDTSNCAYGVLWFLTSPLSGGFFFMQEAHKKRFLKSFRSALPYLTPGITDSELIYIPQPGDYIYFRWKNAAEKTNVSHVGIVSDVKGDTVYTWEGNSGGKVAAHTYDLSDSRIVGYGHPIYQDE